MGYDAATWEREGFRIIGDRAVRLQPSKSNGAAEMPEDTLLAQIRTLTKTTGWLLYHTYNSQRSEKGFPDLVLAKPGRPPREGRLIFAELKSKKGKESREQMIWLDVLQHTLSTVEVYTWRPADWPDIVEILTRK